MKAKYDWPRIEQEYVTGSMALRELATRYKISETTIYKHAKEAKFDEKRRKYLEKVAKKAVTRTSARDARVLARLMTAADKLALKISKAVSDDTVFGYIVQDPPRTDEETGEQIPGGQRVEILTKADTKAIVNMSTAIRNMAMATKVMYPDGDGASGEDERSVVIMPERESEGM